MKANASGEPSAAAAVAAGESHAARRAGFVSRRALWALIATMLGFTGFALVNFLHAEYLAIEARESERLSTQARIVDNILVHQLAATNRVLESIRQDLPGLRAQGDGDTAVSRRLRTMIEAMPGIRTMVLIDAEGTAIASNRDELIGQDFRNGARFQTVRRDANPALLYLSPPFKTPLGTHAVSAGKAVVEPNGRVAAVLLAILEPEYFMTLLDSVRYSPDVWSSIVHEDGHVFLTSPRRKDIEGMDLAKPGSLFTRHRESGQTATVMTSKVLVSGKRQMLAQRTIRPSEPPLDKALVVAVARDPSDIYASWRRDAFLSGGLFSLFVATTVGWLFFRERQEIAFERLEALRVGDRRRAEEKISGIVATAMDAIVTLGEDMRITVFNAAAEKMFGVAAHEAIGGSVERFIPGRFRAAHQAHMQDFADAKTANRRMGRPGKVTALRADGTAFPVEVSISQTTVDGERMFTAILRDVTEQQATERALEEAELRFRSLVENSASGIFLLHRETIEYANGGMARIFGFQQAADLVGVNIFTLLTPPFHGLVRANLQRLQGEVGTALPTGRVRMQRRDGALIDVAASAASMEIGGSVFVQAEVRDITQETRSLAQIRALNASLEQRVAERTASLNHVVHKLEMANGDLESFSYSVAHDLRAPLRSLIGFSSLVEGDLAAGEVDELKQHLRRIVANAEKMNALIDGLLHVAHASHGELSLSRVDCNQLLVGVLEELQAREKAQIDVGALPVIRVDHAAFRQVWVNLISNALKYSAKRPRPRVIIACEAVGEEIIFRIEDNGAGFDQSHAPKLFGVFNRLHSARDYEGIGVGLAIIRRVVERHGGRVWAEGRPDVGATFFFALPVGCMSAA
jgi:PAS domain S-box-containing protein